LYHPRYQDLFEFETFSQKLGISSATEKVQQQTSWGLMQIMGGVAREMGYEGPLAKLCEVETNLYFAGKKFQECLAGYQYNILDALAAYRNGSAKKDSNGKYKNENFITAVKELYTNSKALLKNSRII
jgi:hypothetical protein